MPCAADEKASRPSRTLDPASDISPPPSFHFECNSQLTKSAAHCVGVYLMLSRLRVRASVDDFFEPA